MVVNTAGAPVIDAILTFEFAGLDGIPVTITGRRLQAWALPADWGSNIEEELSWLTQIQQAVDGSEDSEALREAPRRQWEFDVVADRRERRIIENAVYDWAARIWAMPVMPDRSELAADLPAASEAIALDHAHLDYVAGGLAMLWGDLQRYELVEIATTEPGVLGLARPTLQPWPAGTRVYPCRAARLAEAPTWRRRSDQVITSRVRFEASEPCDWPAVAPPAMYLGYPVLEWRADESDDPTASSLRAVEILDGDVGLVSIDDITGRAWAQQSHDFTLAGRSERSAHRSYLYWLAGRYQRLWVPTFADDVQQLELLTSGVSTLFVAAAGITAHLRQQPGRRHLRIERNDGTVHYREVLSSSELDADRELLLIDSPLGADLAPEQVRVISWMALSRQASDRVGITHITDSEGAARSRLSFVTVGAHEP
ncbi:hypothetical protein [Luteimonas terricola]|uniref:hypothetical protein n=1 Tax=Luteimonas terricola TaxID=645597 RepID=UPI001E3AF1B0|nr:hypothetical protein [Luteimonas terricola]